MGEAHFVNDGHHRVSIAAATGQREIDAYVTEVLTARQASPDPATAGRVARPVLAPSPAGRPPGS